MTDEPVQYPWEVPVSAFGGERLLRIGVQGERVVTQPPPFGTFSVDPDDADRIAAFYSAAARRIRIRQVQAR